MGAQPAHRSDPQPRRVWHNALPAWIVESAAWSGLRGGPRATLQAIANACDPPDVTGSLGVAFGGMHLIDTIGIHRTTFFRHVTKLEKAGFLVCLGRGGVIRGKHVGNCWGVPGSPGALDRRARQREWRQMLPGDDGVYRPETVQPGDSPQFWSRRADPPPDADNSQASQNAAPSVAKRYAPAQQNAAPSAAKRDTTISHIPSPGPPPDTIQSVVFSQQRTESRGPKLPHATTADLRDTGRLLALYDAAVANGVADASEADRLAFVAAAEHALRLGHKPTRLFAAIANRGDWHYVTAADEVRATKRLRRHLHGESGPPPRDRDDRTEYLAPT